MEEQVNHPQHYAWFKKFGFNLGNALKYIFRCCYKGTRVTDLEKARWYIDYEIERLKTNKEE